jgi:hypothetical protein
LATQVQGININVETFCHRTIRPGGCKPVGVAVVAEIMGFKNTIKRSAKNSKDFHNKFQRFFLNVIFFLFVIVKKS